MKHLSIMAGAIVCVFAGGTVLAADAGPSSADSGGLEEIVVTAARRSEDLQKVALPVDVVSGDMLSTQGIVRAPDLNKLVPGLAISDNGAYPQLYLRGLGTFGNVTQDSSVLPSLDGVPLGTGAALRGAFYDLARVEVVKGPQGTLYGLNAAAGAVNLISNKPTNTLGGDASVDFGNYSDFKFEGAANIPVNEQLALRAATQIVHRDGYLSDGGSNDHHQSVKLSALYQPTEVFSILLMGDYTHTDGRNDDFVPLPLVEPSNPWLASSSTLGNSRLAPYPVPLVNNQDYLFSHSYGIHAEVGWDLDFATLTVIPAYRRVTSQSTYEPGFIISDATDTQQSSVEARLASPGGGRNRWLFGGYYYDGSQNLLNDHVVQADAPTPPEDYNFFLVTTTYAFFGEDTFSIVDNFRVTGGARYTEERRDAHGESESPPPAVAFGGQTSNRNGTGRVGLEWDVTSKSLMYANWANAVRAGGINADSAPNTFRPEKLTAYTLGSKNVLFDGRLRLNAEAYYWKDKDHQEDVLAARNIGGLAIIEENINKVTIKGIDIDAQFYATRDDVLGFSLERNEARVDQWVYDSPLPAFVVAPTTGCVTTNGPITTALGFPAPGGHVDCSGQPLTRSPKWAGTASVQHTAHLASGGSLVGEVDTRVASRSYLATDYLPSEEQAAYAILNAFVTYNLPGDHWSVQLWGRNLSNKDVFSTTFERPGITGSPPLVYAINGDPRTYGISLKTTF